jgi:hypothetical protein
MVLLPPFDRKTQNFWTSHVTVGICCHSWFTENARVSATMSVSLVSNVYLDETSVKIRAKPVPWEVRVQVDSEEQSPRLTHAITDRVTRGPG